MNKKDNQRKKLFQPDATLIYILDTFPELEKTSMSNYIKSIINNEEER